MLIECKRCGAPLEVEQAQKLATCAYCRAVQRVAPEAVHAAPSDWRAPQQWTPPAHVPAASHPLTFNRDAAVRKQRTLLAAIAILVGLSFCGGILVPLFSVFGLVAVSGRAGGPAAGTTLATWDGSETLVCAGNDRLSLDKVKVSAKAAPAILATGNCRLQLNDCEISATELISAKSNAQIEVVGGKLAANARDAVVLEGGSKLSLRAAALTIDSAEALRAKGNAKIEWTDAIVTIRSSSSQPLVFNLAGNARATLKRSTIVFSNDKPGAAVTFLRGRSNARAEISDGKLTIDTKRAPKSITLFSFEHNGRAKWAGGSITAGGLPLFIKARREVELLDVDLGGSAVRRSKR